MSDQNRRYDTFEFVGAFEQAWIQYKSNFVKLLPFGFLAALPPIGFEYSLPVGIALVLLFEGFFILLLVDMIHAANNYEKVMFLNRLKDNLWAYIKNGFMLSAFIFPLMALGFVALVIPSVIIFGFFMFSFSHVVVKHKFALDACMESYRSGERFRLHIFLFSLIFYSSIVLITIITETKPLFFVIATGIFLPYFFIVVQEFFEQLEKK